MGIELVRSCTVVFLIRVIVIVRIVFWISVGDSLPAEDIRNLATLLAGNLSGTSMCHVCVGSMKAVVGGPTCKERVLRRIADGHR